MSDAIIALQTAAVAALEASPDLAALTGIYDGPPPGAAFPYLSIGGGVSADWSTKTKPGREVRLGVTVWDDPGRALEMYGLMAAAQAALEAIPRDLPGWRIASNVFVRSLVSRGVEAPWAGLIEHRVRMLAV